MLLLKYTPALHNDWKEKRIINNVLASEQTLPCSLRMHLNDFITMELQILRL